MEWRLKANEREKYRTRTERESEKSCRVGAISCCEARAYAFAKQADRITRYYDHGFSLSFRLFLSFSFPLRDERSLCVAAFGKSDNPARQWAGRLSVFALLSNAHSRHNGSYQGAFQFFSGGVCVGGSRIPPLGYARKDPRNETETEGTERREWIKREREILDPVSLPFLGRRF